MWRDLWRVLKREKKWWLIPLLATLAVLAGLAVLAAAGGGGVLGPLLYPSP